MSTAEHDPMVAVADWARPAMRRLLAQIDTEMEQRLRMHQVRYRDGMVQYREAVRWIARAFDVPVAIISSDPLDQRRHAVRLGYRRRQLARRRRRAGR